MLSLPFSERRFLVLLPKLVSWFAPGCSERSSKFGLNLIICMQINTGICDLVCFRCCLRRASHRPSDRRFSDGGTRKIVITSIVKIEGLGNCRVIDFHKHSSNFGLPDLDLEAPPEGHFGAQSAQNVVIYIF